MQKTDIIIPRSIAFANDFDPNDPLVLLSLRFFSVFYVRKTGKTFDFLLFPSKSHYVKKKIFDFLFCYAIYAIVVYAFIPFVFFMLIIPILLFIPYLWGCYKRISMFSKYPIVTLTKTCISFHKRKYNFSFQQDKPIKTFLLDEIKCFIALSTTKVLFHNTPWQLFPGKNATQWDVLFVVHHDFSLDCIMIANNANTFYHSLAKLTNKKIDFPTRRLEGI